MSTEQQFCTFFVDGLFFGVEVHKVQEVIRYQGLTAVPLAPSVIGGLINLRGQIVTAVDLRKRLALSERAGSDQPMNVVVRAEGGAVSLLVDEIGDVVEVEQMTYEAPPDTLKGIGQQLIRGVYKLKDRLLLLLDIERAVDINVATRTREAPIPN